MGRAAQTSTLPRPEAAVDSPAAAAAKYLPDWAGSPVPDRVEGPFVVVRRITDSDDPSIVSSLHRRLDVHIGGTVELADEGPLAVEDLRLAGANAADPRPEGVPADCPDRTSEPGCGAEDSQLFLF